MRQVRERLGLPQDKLGVLIGIEDLADILLTASRLSSDDRILILKSMQLRLDKIKSPVES